MNLKNKHVAVVGLGKSGFGAALFLRRLGACVRVTDAASGAAVAEKAKKLRNLGVRVETGGHVPGFVSGCDLLVVSPGVPKKNRPLLEARAFQIPVISEIELASRFCKGRIIAVTGSNGKTTTCHLIRRMLKEGGKKVVLCGNVGTPFVSVLSKIGKKTFTVLEVSSFQLQDSPAFSPDIALVLNVSPNHLDHHENFKEYFRAKKNIFRRQTKNQALVLNFDRKETRALRVQAKSRVYFFGKQGIRGKGLFVRNGMFCLSEGRGSRVLFAREDFPLKGLHNLENILAASLAALLAGVAPRAILKTLRRFKTLPHRIEPAGSRSGVAFIDDSKSTTVDSTLAALEAVAGPVVLIAGGRDKGADFSALKPALKKKVRYAVFYGEARRKIAAALRPHGDCRLEKDFRKAVKAAFGSARPGDAVLLSPMCASFDQFASYAERGDVFKKTVRHLGMK